MTKAQIAKLVRSRAGIRLDVGCGGNPQPGFVGMDKRKLPTVDIVHDIEQTPWPLPDNCCAVVVLAHVWEHILPTRTLDVMQEIHRVCQHNGIVMLAGPYGLGFRFVQDPTHVGALNEATLAYFDPLHPSGLWGVYKPPVLHLENFVVVPAPPGDRDYEAAMRVCKQFKNGACPHVSNGGGGRVPSKHARRTNRHQDERQARNKK